MPMTMWNSKHVKQCEDLSRLAFNQSDKTLATYQSDFGNLYTNPLMSAVVKPENNQQLSTLLSFANQNQLPLTVRCLGLSQSGQSIPIDGGVSVDMTGFNKVSVVENNQITVGAGTKWRDLVTETLKYDLLPLVFPYNMNLSIGGLLSVGGLGSASFKFGVAASHVKQMDVIQANGEINTCREGDELFHASLAGLGQFGVIIEASIALRSCKKYVRSFYLLYDDHATWLEDQSILKQQVDFLEAYSSPLMLGLKKTSQGRQPLVNWFYCTHCGFEYNDQAPDVESLPVGGYAKISHIEDNTIYDYVMRHDNRFIAMQESGQWQMAHPWYECYLPKQLLLDNFDEILVKTSLGFGGVYHIFPLAKQVPRFFMLPEDEDIVTFNILTPGVMPHQLNACKKSIDWLNQLFLNHGGKRYVSGWLGEKVEKQFWAAHYGDRFLERQALKNKYDPNTIFCSCLFPERS